MSRPLLTRRSFLRTVAAGGATAGTALAAIVGAAPVQAAPTRTGVTDRDSNDRSGFGTRQPPSKAVAAEKIRTCRTVDTDTGGSSDVSSGVRGRSRYQIDSDPSDRPDCRAPTIRAIPGR